jgi:hypothetical protein
MRIAAAMKNRMTYYHGLMKKREKGLTIIITIKKKHCPEN